MKRKTKRLTQPVSRTEAVLFIVVALFLVSSLTALFFRNQVQDLVGANVQPTLAPLSVEQLPENLSEE